MRTKKQLIASIFSLILILTLGLSQSLADNVGSISSLVPTGTNPVDIDVELQIDDGVINNSNLRLFIYDSDGNLVASHGPVSVPRLEVGGTETFTYNWPWTNPGLGDHTVEACWSRGGSSNCNVDEASTNFTSVSTLGTLLTVTGILLVGLWFFYFIRRERQTA